jgi:hypothetical protein
MAHITGNLLDWRGNPRPDLFPIIVVAPRNPGYWAPSVFITKELEVVPAPSGAFEFDLIASTSTSSPGLYDVYIKWVNGEGVAVGFDYLTDEQHPLVVLEPGGELAAMLQVEPTALEVHIGETNDTRYRFWYQPSSAMLRSNP